MERLRRISPVSDRHSYLVPVWYVAGQRWVLYEAQPANLLRAHPERPVSPTILADDVLQAMDGPRPSTLPRSLFSDVQWELWRTHQAFCLPFWCLQGMDGGHLVYHTETQERILKAKGHRGSPPPIGRAAYETQRAAWESERVLTGDESESVGPPPVYLEPCSFDTRTEEHLARFNRLMQLAGKLEHLQASGDPVTMEKEAQDSEREIRKAELAAIEQFLAPVSEVFTSARKKSETRDELIYVDGQSDRTADRLDYWIETGQFT